MPEKVADASTPDAAAASRRVCIGAEHFGIALLSPVRESDAVGTSVADTYVDLAPEIFRQRLVVEGTCLTPVTDVDIRDYLLALSGVAGMTVLAPPVTHRSDRFGWAGWIHWETSGAHFYGWEQPRVFFSVDMYTCKAFDPDAVVQFTRQYFDAVAITAREF